MVIAQAIKPVEVAQKTLPNGLKVYVVEDHSAPVVSVQVWYRVGSRNEDESYAGIAHMLEHMMFRGSANVEGKYSEIIDQMGGSDNAFTSEDMTVYHCVIPSGLDNLDKVLFMEADRMQNLTFEGFLKERDVVREERRWRTENSAWGSAWEALKATAFMVHPYRHPVIGWAEAIENYTLEKVQWFYRTYYVPNNAFIVISGDVNPEDAFKLVEKHFGKIPKGPEPPKVFLKEPEQRGERVVVLKKEGFMTFLFVAYKIPEAKDPDMVKLDVLATVLGGGKSSRLWKALVEEKGLATGAWAYTDEGLDPGLLVIGANLKQGVDPDSALAAIDQVIEGVKEGVKEEEVAKARKQALADFVFGQESAVGLGFAVGDAIFYHNDPDFVNRYPKLVAEVSPEDVRLVAEQYLVRDKRTVLKLLPKAPEDLEAYIRMMKEASKKEFKY